MGVQTTTGIVNYMRLAGDELGQSDIDDPYRTLQKDCCTTGLLVVPVRPPLCMEFIQVTLATALVLKSRVLLTLSKID